MVALVRGFGTPGKESACDFGGGRGSTPGRSPISAGGGSAVAAAAAVGDDRLQQQAGRDVNPEEFTHGTSEQRVEWFQRGFESGDPNSCDTFDGGE